MGLTYQPVFTYKYQVVSLNSVEYNFVRSLVRLKQHGFVLSSSRSLYQQLFGDSKLAGYGKTFPLCINNFYEMNYTLKNKDFQILQFIYIHLKHNEKNRLFGQPQLTDSSKKLLTVDNAGYFHHSSLPLSINTDHYHLPKLLHTKDFQTEYEVDDISTFSFICH